MRVLRLAGAAVVIAGCGGGGDGGGGPSPQPVASVTIAPNTAQSTTLCGEVNFTAQARDAQQNVLSRTISWNNTAAANVALSSSSGPSVTATGIGVGASTITATAEGISSTGVTVTVAAGGQAPTTAAVAATSADRFSPVCVTVAAGGTVTWTFGATAHNVNFTAGSPTGGDIPDRVNTTEQRTFPSAGNFPYRCTIHANMNGRIIVRS
jgi:plastocyanin